MNILDDNGNILLLLVNSPYNFTTYIDSNTYLKMHYKLKILSHISNMFHYFHIKSSLLFHMDFYRNKHNMVLRKGNNHSRSSNKCKYQLSCMLNILRLNNSEYMFLQRLKYNLIYRQYMQSYHESYSLLFQ